jgi:hypothetical protein
MWGGTKPNKMETLKQLTNEKIELRKAKNSGVEWYVVNRNLKERLLTFLEEKGALQKFKLNFERHTGCSFDEDIDKYVARTDGNQLFTNAFPWHGTPEGDHYWTVLYIDFEDYTPKPNVPEAEQQEDRIDKLCRSLDELKLKLMIYELKLKMENLMEVKKFYDRIDDLEDLLKERKS